MGAKDLPSLRNYKSCVASIAKPGGSARGMRKVDWKYISDRSGHLQVFQAAHHVSVLGGLAFQFDFQAQVVD
jgi:hypothetical protein